MNWEILRKYKQGSCSERELRQLGKWLAENPANEDFFQTYIESKDDGSINHDFPIDAQKAWQEFKSNYDIPASSKTVKGTTRHKGGRRRPKQDPKYWYALVATVIIFIVALAYVVPQWKGTDASAPQKKAVKKIATAKGQRTHLELSDGTHVILNAQSVLKIPENYGKDTRTLYLQGEAFFDVPHNEALPFFVITNQGFVQDLGTQFNIMAYDSTVLEVAVKEGRVSMGEVKEDLPQKKLAELTRHELGVLKMHEGLTVTNIKNMAVFTGWTQGKLIFKHTSLKEVVQRLERWYNIDCMVEDPRLLQRTLTATYTQMSLKQVLSVLTVSMRLSYEKQGNKVIFHDNIG